jgi:dynein heavy chain
MASATQTESSSSDYSQVLVPILESVRITYLINIIATQEHPVLLIGEQGSGKTVMMKSYMRSAKPELYLSRSFNFSSATSPFQFQVNRLKFHNIQIENFIIFILENY